ncbi:MAG: hypothetical protein ACU85E_07375 [Gammaproteobacteria bacterium]
MLLESYNKKGLLSITSVLGATSESGKFAFRGDLVLKEGELLEGSQRDRKTPEFVIHQSLALASEDKLLFVSGLFYELDKLAMFVDKYKEALTPDTLLLFYVENIDEKMKVSFEGFTFLLVPYPGGMVWNELLEELYIEKSDLKGQSAEDKVITVFEAAKDFDTKSAALSLEDASLKTVEVVKDLAAGPV